MRCFGTEIRLLFDGELREVFHGRILERRLFRRTINPYEVDLVKARFKNAEKREIESVQVGFSTIEKGAIILLPHLDIFDDNILSNYDPNRVYQIQAVLDEVHGKLFTEPPTTYTAGVLDEASLNVNGLVRIGFVAFCGVDESAIHDVKVFNKATLYIERSRIKVAGRKKRWAVRINEAVPMEGIPNGDLDAYRTIRTDDGRQ